MLARLHKPNPKLPDDAQDKRSLVPLESGQWDAWLHSSEADVRTLLTPPAAELFDLADAHRTDEALAALGK